MGAALARWQFVETALYVIAHALMQSDWEGSSVIFFHIQSGNNKLVLIDKLLSARIATSTIRTHWKPLRKQLSDYLEIRNAMAHFEFFHIDLSVTKGETKYPVALSPNYLDRAAQRNGTVKALYVETLEAAKEEFLTLAKEVIRFGMDQIPLWREQIKRLPPDLQRVLEIIRRTGSVKDIPPPP